MSRPLPATFVPLPVNAWGPGRPIEEGHSGTSYGEIDLVRNLHHLQGYAWPAIVEHVFLADNGYLEGASTNATTRAGWRRRIYQDVATWRVTV